MLFTKKKKISKRKRIIHALNLLLHGDKAATRGAVASSLQEPARPGRVLDFVRARPGVGK